MRSANLAIKFGLELAALAAVAYWGPTLPGAVASAIVPAAAALAIACTWGILAAPRSGRRLRAGLRIPFELAVFALAAAALLAAGQPALAAAFAVTAAVNAILLTAFHQWPVSRNPPRKETLHEDDDR